MSFLLLLKSLIIVQWFEAGLGMSSMSSKAVVWKYRQKKKCFRCWPFRSTQVKTWAQLLNTFCSTGKLELELIYKVQMQCYEDAKLMKLFPEIVRSLYDQDVLAEDTILHWFRKGTNPKGRYANHPSSSSLICSFVLLFTNPLCLYLQNLQL